VLILPPDSAIRQYGCYNNRSYLRTAPVGCKAYL